VGVAAACVGLGQACLSTLIWVASPSCSAGVWGWGALAHQAVAAAAGAGVPVAPEEEEGAEEEEGGEAHPPEVGVLPRHLPEVAGLGAVQVEG
jgi:hypothetical protein